MRETAPKRHSKPPTPDRAKPRPTPVASGLVARDLALSVISGVIDQRRSFDQALAAAHDAKATALRTGDVDDRDRGFARLLAMTTLRRHGQLKQIIARHLKKALPKSGRRAELVLMLGAAQLLFLGSPPHAVINTAVDLCRQQRTSARFDKLVNAVLRRIARDGRSLLAEQDAAALNFPDWMLSRWITAYGAAEARAIAVASLNEAPLDLTVKGKPDEWADQLNAIRLETGSLRCQSKGRIEELPGFGDGQWWVQDAAAAIPARLLGNVDGLAIADLCAAPGGKTAQLAAGGAIVTAVDVSKSRLARVRDNLSRLALTADLIEADARTWSAGRQFDGVLVDAPCTATGTIRRHPDILHLKRPADMAAPRALQEQLLANGAQLLKPGGVMVYCTCSLEPEEGEDQIEHLLRNRPEFHREPVAAHEVGNLAGAISPAGDVRTFPTQLANHDPALSGLDGFYICRLRRGN